MRTATPTPSRPVPALTTPRPAWWFSGDPKPRRDDLFAALSNALTLKPTADTPGSEWRSEMYQVENLSPSNVVLQIVSSNGDAFTAAIMGN